MGEDIGLASQANVEMDVLQNKATEDHMRRVSRLSSTKENVGISEVMILSFIFNK